MALRHAFRAGSFYPADADSCRHQIEECLSVYQPQAEPQHVIAGIVPHAGWMFSGPTAAKVFKNIQDKTRPDTFIILGAVHVWGMEQKASMFAKGAWETPCGPVDIDEDLAQDILLNVADFVTDDESAHIREHSIEVQVPFLRYIFPEVKIVPIMVNPTPNAIDIGRRIGQLLRQQKKQVIVLGSTDLTHYGPRFGFTPHGIGIESLAPMKHHDRQFIDLITAMDAHEVLLHAEQHHSACGAGAIAATIAAAQELGATQGYLLEHTTSQDVMPDRPASDFVGYTGIIF
ncbi:AmmeMemoRadiSam system protein B [candidate division KSB3 bacterium]|uniref:AmmeMemoRadiSam system protein B n=1 Tax=candidate division KSB3 bacterium TaxID=2044937 RepID=A0A2G6KAY4_9BACT|nr:MAG: AmmeMemoRadiSam system protein B [candidate division KSB3 bacterium]